MANITKSFHNPENPLDSVKVVYRRSNPLTKVVVTAAIVLSMAALIAMGWTQHQIEEETRDMRAKAAQLEAENARLEEKIDSLGSVQSVMEIAQEELGLVNPDTVVIQPN